MKLITDIKALNTAIDSIARRGKKLDEDIQLAGLSCLNHIDQHGDVTVLCRLFNAMPRGSRRNALAAWAAAHGKVQVNVDSKTNKEKPFLFDRTRGTQLEAAAESPWWDFKPERPLEEEFDFEAALAALFNRARKAKEQGITIKGQDKLDKLLATVA